MAAWVAPAIMAAASLATAKMSNDSQEANAKKQMLLRAAEQEASPWTGIAAQTQANFESGNVGNLLQGAVAGYGAGQSINQAGKQQDLNDAWLKMLNRQNAMGGTPTLMSGMNASPSYNA